MSESNWYEVAYVDDYPDSLDEIEALRHKQAAEIFVDELDEEGRTLAEKEGSEDVKVRLKGEEKWRKFRVSGRISVDYTAKEIE